MQKYNIVSLINQITSLQSNSFFKRLNFFVLLYADSAKKFTIELFFFVTSNYY
jgi:hypothetical protein